MIVYLFRICVDRFIDDDEGGDDDDDEDSRKRRSAQLINKHSNYIKQACSV